MCENKEFARDKQELADDLLDQVAGGAEEGEIQVFYCARDCKCSREFKCDANGKWVCICCAGKAEYGSEKNPNQYQFNVPESKTFTG